MKLFACLLAAAAAAADAAEGNSPRATLHVGLEECITAANIVRAARLNTRLGLIERSTELENDANKELNTALSFRNSCEELQRPYEEGIRMEVPLSSSSLHALVHDVYACIGTPFVSSSCFLASGSSSSSSGELFVSAAYGGFLFYVFEGKDANCLEGMVEYPPAYNQTVTPWDDPEMQIALHVLWQTTKSAGCAYTTDCPVNWMLCGLSPQPEEQEYPFT
ncbi:hypothetical protein Efla_000639 [Eimeria flavescens]